MTDHASEPRTQPDDELHRAIREFVFDVVQKLFDDAKGDPANVPGVAVALLITDVMTILGEECPPIDGSDPARTPGKAERFVHAWMPPRYRDVAAKIGTLRTRLHHDLSLKCLKSELTITLSLSPATDLYGHDQSITFDIREMFDALRDATDRFFLARKYPVQTFAGKPRPAPPIVGPTHFPGLGTENISTKSP